ncbi:MAG TPA: response regulator [Polyangiaceae bacterium]|nr:response regulator [Polyangiaceae bacterium]
MTTTTSVSTASAVAVIDDDPSVRRSLTNLFDSLGFFVTSFASAEDFLASDVSTTGCVVLDHRLPGMSGLELLERLLSVPSSMGVVMITAHADQQVRRRAVELGADAFFAKPFRSEDLVESVQRRLTPMA